MAGLDNPNASPFNFNPTLSPMDFSSIMSGFNSNAPMSQGMQYSSMAPMQSQSMPLGYLGSSENKLGTPGTDWMGTGKSIIGGIQGLAGLYNAYQANKLGKQQLSFQKEAYGTNLANSIKSYNTALGTKARSIGEFKGQSKEEVDSYIAANRL